MSLSVRASPQDPPETAGGEPYRVAIVEESAVVRGMMSRWLSEDGSLDVVARFINNNSAKLKIEQLDVEVLIVDIDDKKGDDDCDLTELLHLAPTAKIAILSKDAGDAGCQLVDFRGQGVSQILRRPATTRDVTNSKSFPEELMRLVKDMGAGLRKNLGQDLPSPKKPKPGTKALEPAARQRDSVAKRNSGTKQKSEALLTAKTIEHKRSKVSEVPASILAVGSSTGGPKALYSVFESLNGKISVPVVITQHMPPMFTGILAQHLTKASGLVAKEAEDGEPLKAGHIYVAPGDYHLEVKGSCAEPVIKLNQGPEENFCRPSVDPMLRSVRAIYGRSALCVILTGMGQDGCKGAKSIIEGGGTVIAQDEETSVVWGMPGAVVRAGLAADVLPLDEIGPCIGRLLKGGKK